MIHAARRSSEMEALSLLDDNGQESDMPGAAGKRLETPVFPHIVDEIGADSRIGQQKTPPMILEHPKK